MNVMVGSIVVFHCHPFEILSPFSAASCSMTSRVYSFLSSGSISGESVNLCATTLLSSKIS